MQLPTLYHLGSANVVYQWSIRTEGNQIITEHGLVSGKKMTAVEIAEPKNIGKANATTAESQAEFQAKSQWKHKLDRKYVEDISKVSTRKISPMLAPNDGFEITKKYVKYPAYLQIKYNGLRCLSYLDNDRVVLLSRGLKEYNLPHIKEQLKTLLTPGHMFDGELYLHGVSLQTINSWIRGERVEAKNIQYHIYDIPICDGEEKPQNERIEDLDRLIKNSDKDGVVEGAEQTPHILKAPTFIVNSDQEVIRLQAELVEMGFEGAMIRNMNALYKWGHRSKDLLKVKVFSDQEFEVVGYKCGKGKNTDTVTWRCKTVDGKEFDVEPNGTQEERREMLINAESYLGKMLTVKYFGYSDDMIPQLPKGLGFRLKEDLA